MSAVRTRAMRKSCVVNKDVPILVQKLSEQTKVPRKTSGGSSRKSTRKSVGAVTDGCAFLADLKKTPEKCPFVAETAYAALSLKVDTLTSMLQPMHSLFALFESPSDIGKMPITKCSSLIDSISTEVQNRVRCSRNAVVFNVPDKLPMKTVQRVLLSACGMQTCWSSCTRLRKKFIRYDCPILFQFENELIARQFIRNCNLIQHNTTFKRLKIIEDKTPLQRELRRRQLEANPTAKPHSENVSVGGSDKFGICSTPAAVTDNVANNEINSGTPIRSLDHTDQSSPLSAVSRSTPSFGTSAMPATKLITGTHPPERNFTVKRDKPTKHKMPANPSAAVVHGAASQKASSGNPKSFFNAVSCQKRGNNAVQTKPTAVPVEPHIQSQPQTSACVIPPKVYPGQYIGSSKTSKDSGKWIDCMMTVDLDLSRMSPDKSIASPCLNSHPSIDQGHEGTQGAPTSLQIERDLSVYHQNPDSCLKNTMYSVRAAWIDTSVPPPLIVKPYDSSAPKQVTFHDENDDCVFTHFTNLYNQQPISATTQATQPRNLASTSEFHGSPLYNPPARMSCYADHEPAPVSHFLQGHTQSQPPPLWLPPNPFSTKV
ncbi:unnamed protein product, partial [Dicrocoelium dendriticum]